MHKKLMIVDDSRFSRTIIRAYFQAECPDWVFLEAASGADAITLAQQELPDFCTMDINMAGMSGLEAAGILLLNHPALRLVILSANIQDACQERAKALGVLFVAKPVVDKSITQARRYFERQE